MLITRSALPQGLRLQPTDLVLDLESRFRCRECDVRGKAVVSVRWGDASVPNLKFAVSLIRQGMRDSLGLWLGGIDGESATGSLDAERE